MDTPIGQFVLIGNFRRRLARELLVNVFSPLPRLLSVQAQVWADSGAAYVASTARMRVVLVSYEFPGRLFGSRPTALLIRFDRSHCRETTCSTCIFYACVCAPCPEVHLQPLQWQWHFSSVHCEGSTSSRLSRDSVVLQTSKRPGETGNLMGPAAGQGTFSKLMSMSCICSKS